MTIREQAQAQLESLNQLIESDRARMLELIQELSEVQDQLGDRLDARRRTRDWIARHDAWVRAGSPRGPRHVTGRPQPWSEV